MRNVTILLTLIVALNACRMNAPGYEKPAPEVTPIPSPSASVSPAPTVSPIGSFTFKCVTCTKQEAANIKAVEAAIPVITAKDCFARHFTDKNLRSQLIQTNGLSESQVVDLIRTATVKDIPIVFYYPSWRQSKNVVGYTNYGEPTIYLNRNFREWDGWSGCQEVSNLLHEVTHKSPLNFEHDYKATARRPYSVPYTVNFAVENCCVDSDVKGYK